jgi:hypothetical protein
MYIYITNILCVKESFRKKLIIIIINIICTMVSDLSWAVDVYVVHSEIPCFYEVQMVIAVFTEDHNFTLSKAC